MGSQIIHLLREQEKKARLRFWKMLLTVSPSTSVACPVSKNAPPDAVYIGEMPANLRASFARAYELRSEERKAEAEIFEEAFSETIQEHFKKTLLERRVHHEPEIAQFILAKDWKIYAMPITIA